MKKFTFTMQSILNARSAQKSACEHALVQARHRLEREKQQLQLIQRKIDDAMDVNFQDTTPSFLVQRGKYLNSLKKQRNQQLIRINAANSEVQVCVSRLRLADIEMKKMEKLQERELDQWHDDNNRDQQKLNDEIGVTLAFFNPKQSQHGA